ncbi:kelch-like protein 10 isoform X1 [Paralichthys olivaceus]|uniref:kelch-like protein 10 isoform X1 n=1 Tax=Paralichthys olivaceus TaxID=8255 RepID=UPI0037515058
MRRTVYNELRLAGLFCNAIIEVEDVHFRIHRAILYDCSPYFQALFERWPTKNNVFRIPIVSADMMRLIIDFAYTGSVALIEDNVQELMIKADMLNIMGIIQACSDFISEKLCPHNCTGIWQFTNIFRMPELRCKAFCYIIKHFEEVAHCKEFLQLSAEELTKIIGKDELNVRIESSVFDAILRWIAHVPKEREQHIAVLLSQVRLGLIDMDYIVSNVITNRLVKNDPQCKTIVKDSKCIVWHATHTPLMCGLSNTLARPRVPNSILLITGGWKNNTKRCDIEVYNPLADLWIDVSDKMEHPRAYHGTAFLDGRVYCIGGFDRLNFFNSVDRLDLATHTWQEMASMHYSRSYVSVTVLNGFIYAFGGSDGQERHNTAERYCPETNQWTLIAPMHEQRSDASCTVLHDKIYICGGFSGTVYLNTAEYYDPETNLWTMISPMRSRRRGLRVAAYNNQIYAVGGFDGNNHLSVVETYTPQSNTWHLLSPMLTRRRNFCLEVIEDQFYVFGGFNSLDRTIGSREVYCPSTDSWDEVCTSNMPRRAAGSCVVSAIPNMAELTLPQQSLLRSNLGHDTNFSD